MQDMIVWGVTMGSPVQVVLKISVGLFMFIVIFNR